MQRLNNKEEIDPNMQYVNFVGLHYRMMMMTNMRKRKLEITKQWMKRTCMKMKTLMMLKLQMH